MKKLAFLSGCLMFFMAHSGFAATKGGGELILGAGGDACLKLTTAWDARYAPGDTIQNAIARAEYLAWIQGFSSAASQLDGRLKGRLASDFVELLESTLRRCRRSPRTLVANGLIAELKSFRK